MADNRYGERGGGRSDSIFSDDERGRPAGGEHRDRGFLQRAGEEVRSWFGGDEEAPRRHDQSRREVWGGGSDWSGGSPYDDQYTSWRDRQISLLDREYEDYCRHRQQQFENEFHNWRQSREGQGASAMPSGGATAQGGSRLTPDASSGTGGRSRGRAAKANS